MATSVALFCSRTSLLCCGIFAAGLAWALLPSSPAQAGDMARYLRQGAFIVATHNLSGTVFGQTVILITQHGKTGSMGLTVNRPTEISLGEAFPDVEGLRARPGALFLGGPVSPRAVFVLVQTERPRAGMQRVAKGVYLSEGVGALAEGPPEGSAGESAYVFAGYAGWAPGQLEAEIARGDWIVAWEDPAVAFSKDLKGLWNRLLESWSGRWT